jgi:hypothetical protein
MQPEGLTYDAIAETMGISVNYVGVKINSVLFNYDGLTKIVSVIYVLFLIETAAIFYLYFRQKFNLNDKIFLLPAHQFADKILKNLSREKVFIKFWLNLYVLIIVVQLNIILLFSVNFISSVQQVILHILITTFIIVVFFFGLKKRINPYNNEVKPLVEKFTAMKNGLSDNSDL